MQQKRHRWTQKEKDAFVGLRFDRLTIESVFRGDRGRTYVKASCSCGGNTVSVLSAIHLGRTKSCGCLKVEIAKVGNATHGHSRLYKRSRTMAAFHNMHVRCENPRSKKYKNYGMRGVKVCPEWAEFAQFLADMGECPEGLTLDRVDVNGPYCKENCVWETPKNQARNRTNTVRVTYKGESKPLTEWCDLLGLKRGTIYNRLRSGMSVSAAFEKPTRYKK